MSSKIEIQRICQHCGDDFTARTTVTRFCSHKCSSAAHKQKVRTGKIEASNQATERIKKQPIEELKVKEFLTVREVAHLLNCSVRSAYYYIECGTINAVNLGQRITRVKRSEIDKLFEQPQPVKSQTEQKQIEFSECYNYQELKSKYGFSQRGIEAFVSRNKITKLRKGSLNYVPKSEIDKLLS